MASFQMIRYDIEQSIKIPLKRIFFMNKFFKITAQVVGFLIVLYVLLMIFLYIFVQTKDFKPFVEKFFYEHTGQTLHVNGDIKLSIFPWPSVKATNIVIDNPKNFSVPSDVQYFAKIGDAQVTVKMASLFHGKVTPKNVVLDNINVNMVTSRSGEANWENLYHFTPTKQTKTTDTTTKASQPVAQTKTKKTTIADFPVIEITNTNLHFINLMTNQRTDVTNLQLRTPASRTTSQRQISFHCNVQHNNPSVYLNLSLQTMIHFISSDTINLNDFELRTQWIRFKTKFDHPIALSMKGKVAMMNDNFKSQFDGQFDGSRGEISLSASRQNGTILSAMTISNLNVVPLVKLLSGKEWIQGTLNATTQLKTTGNSYHQWLNRLSGNGSVKVTDGKIYGLNMALLVTETLNRLLSSTTSNTPQTTETPNNQSETTPFASMSADFTVSSGVAETNNFLLTAKQLKSTGKGEVNLPDATIDATLLTTYADNTKWQIPLRITGSVTKPKVQPDTAAIAQRILKEKLQKDVGKTLDNVKKQLDKIF